jgi:hypothetical protein
MTSDNKVIPLHPYNPIEIDDSRLQAMWRSHDRRQGMIYGVLGLGGVAAILLAVAAVVWAGMSNQPTPQIKVNVEPPNVNVQPPNVTVNVPQQPAPVVNITVPERPLLPSEPKSPARTEDGAPVKTEIVIFKEVRVGDLLVDTGWQYRHSTDTIPYRQWCYTYIGATGSLQLGINGQPWQFLARDARTLNLPEAQAQALLKQCQWYPG